MNLPAIPKDWTIERLRQALARAQRMAAQYRTSEPRTADYYDAEIKQLTDELLARNKLPGAIA